MLHLQLFWEKHAFFDPATCLPPDRMHQADQGIFKSILSWTVDLLETMAINVGGGKLQNTKIDELNRYLFGLCWPGCQQGACHRRFKTLVPFTDLKIFPHGITHLSQMNAFEYRDIMKAAVVCFKGECNNM